MSIKTKNYPLWHPIARPCMETHLHWRLHPWLHFHRCLAQSVPDIYPQVLALPLSGFLQSTSRSKSWCCCSRSTIPKALGAFLLKDKNTNQSSLLHHRVRLLHLWIGKLLKSPVRSSTLIISLHNPNYHKTHYKQPSCTNSTSQLSTSRVPSLYHIFFHLGS